MPDDCTMSERVLRARLAARRRPARADLPLPACLTKLPTAPAAAADSGWTAILRPTLRGGPRRIGARRGRDRSDAVAARGRATRSSPGRSLAARSPRAWARRSAASGLESGESFVGALRPRRASSAWDLGFGSGLRAGRERRGLRRADVAAREPGLGVERGVGVGASAAAGDGPARASASCRPCRPERRGGVGSDEAEQLGRFRILGVLGQGRARHGLPRLRRAARSRRGAEGAAPGVLRDGQGAGAVPGRGPGAGAAAASADRAGLRGGPRRRPALHRHGADRGPQPGRPAGRGRPAPARRRRGAWPPTWPRPWPMPTPWGSCTGTSSRPTSGSTTAATCT